MQNKGFVKFLAVALTIICLFYLSFSVATNYYDGEAKRIAEAKGQAAADAYLDSLSADNTSCYLWYNLKQCREISVGLGLDLKGGMNVVLEVSVGDVIKSLSDYNQDPAFLKSVEEATKGAQESQNDFISLFVKAYKANTKGKPLAAVFATQQLSDRINANSSDSDVEKVLRERVDDAVDNSFNVLRSRIDRFGVVQPNIQKIEGEIGRIMVELPGIKEPERVRKLLQGSANLEFYETYDASAVAPYLSELDRAYRTGQVAVEEEEDITPAEEVAEEVEAEEVADSAKTGKKAADILGGVENEEAEAAETTTAADASSLFAVLDVRQTYGCMVGTAADTVAVNKIINSDIAKQILPSDLSLKWDVKADKNRRYNLYAIRVPSNGRAPLEGEVVDEAKADFDQFGAPVVSMKMNNAGARKWAELTEKNVNHCVAIVLDNLVYSAPNVKGKIDGGRTEISGSFTTNDTKDLANVLQSGKMPASASIVQEDIVGPTLGAQSIRAGFISCVVAFIILMLYMVLMYGVREGMVANLALILNFFFSFGILTSLGAALTMSGIAGMVLTLGMAVDANVLIYERTKEEMKSGKNIAAAVSAGYSNAFSAIFDSNVTTILTGIILFNFGTGPIKGFATTLVIGIICSFFTAVWLTRIVYEHFLNKGKWQNLKFTTALSKNMMQGTKFNFMGNFKKSYIFFGILLAGVIASFCIRGLSQSIDFTGGRNYKVEFVKDVQPENVKASIVKQFEANNPSGEAINVTVIALGTEGNNVRVSTNYLINENNAESDAKIESLLYQAFVDGGMVDKNVSEEAFLDRDNREGGSIVSSQKVGPSIAEDITYGAIMSVLFAIAVIFVYILIRFRNVAYSVGSIIALALDTVLVIGMFSVCYGWIGFSLEIDQTFIGAILTVIGYSINDKVVIFDRIRETFKNYPKRDRQRIFNDSLNSTLARTINTSVSTFIVLLVIFVLGGDSIRAFAFAMMLGVIIGTSSSLFIAAPTAYLVMGARIKEADEEKVVEEKK